MARGSVILKEWIWKYSFGSYREANPPENISLMSQSPHTVFHPSPALTPSAQPQLYLGLGSSALWAPAFISLLRSMQGPPKWAEGCLSFGLNNHTMSHIFPLNGKAHLLGGSASSLTWTIIHPIHDEILSSSLLCTWIVSLFWRYSRLLLYFMSDISFSLPSA